MTRTVDVVIVGANAAAITATADAANRGLRVLLVIRLRLANLPLELRHALRLTRVSLGRQVSVASGAEVVCVDGVRAIEAVVVRHVRTGRLTGFNASALLDFEESGRRATSSSAKD
jgi:hypothetical protein